MFRVWATSASLNGHHNPSHLVFDVKQAERVCWTLSNTSTSLTWYGFQTGAAYSTIGRARDLYNAPGFDEPTSLYTKPNSLLALLTVTLTCLLQDKCEETVISKSLTCFTLLRFVPNEYVGREKSRLCVIRKTSHLKRSCNLDAQDRSWSTSSSRASLSLAICDSSL